MLRTTFQVGEKVVYPNHGVATIENISSRAFAGQFERFYLLRQTYNSLTVMVPFSHAEELRMRDGSLLGVAEVLKSLLILQAEKPLSFREKKMLDRARHMLITELSTSRGLKEDHARTMLDQALAKAQLHLPEPL